jgi:hypothetical protein
MRAHFTICPKRPAASDQVNHRGRSLKVKGGHPQGPRMKCGWGCGAQLTGRNMRAHFTICAKRPAGSDHVDPRRRNSKVKRGPPAADGCGAAAPDLRRRSGEGMRSRGRDPVDDLATKKCPHRWYKATLRQHGLPDAPADMSGVSQEESVSDGACGPRSGPDQCTSGVTRPELSNRDARAIF